MNTYSRKSFFSHDEIMQCSHGKLFGPDCGRLPLSNMLMLDRIVQISADEGDYGKGRVVGELDLSPNQWFFKGHFKDDPIMPGSLGLDALWQALGFFLSWTGYQGKGRALGVGEVKFKKQILPTGRKLTYQVDIKKIVPNHSTLALADGKVFVDDQEAFTARSLRLAFLKD